MFKRIEFLKRQRTKQSNFLVNAARHMRLYLLQTLVKSHPIYPRISASITSIKLQRAYRCRRRLLPLVRRCRHASEGLLAAGPDAARRHTLEGP